MPETEKLSYTFYVDTAYVRGGTVMPQYMLAMRPEIQLEDWLLYKEDGVWYDSEGNPVDLPSWHDEKTIHLPGMVKGDYLFNAQDSVANNPDYEGKFAYGAAGTTRLAL